MRFPKGSLGRRPPTEAMHSLQAFMAHCIAKHTSLHAGGQVRARKPHSHCIAKHTNLHAGGQVRAQLSQGKWVQCRPGKCAAGEERAIPARVRGRGLG